MDDISMLTCFALTRQEAVIYLELLKSGKMTGYEVSKRTGISRSNVYTALAGLAEKGAADAFEGEPTYYAPVSVKDFCETRIHHLKEYSSELEKHVSRPKTKLSGYASVKGAAAVVDRLRSFICSAESRIYISAAWSIMRELENDLFDAVKRGLRVVAITTPPFELYGAQVYLTDIPSAAIRLIIDNTLGATGEYTGAEEGCSCIYSGSESIKELIKDALKSEIRSITVKNAK